MRPVFIYTLEYPEGNVRYVGKTVNVHGRLLAHLKVKDIVTYKNNWIRGLSKIGVIPIINVIDIVTENDWKFWEIYWISQFKSWGFKLTNGTIGGEGLSNPSKEIREKISKSLTGRTESQETRDKKSVSFKGRVWSESHKEKYHDSRVGHSVSQNQIEKQSSTMKAKFLSGDMTHWNIGNPRNLTIWNKDKKYTREERIEKFKNIKKVLQFNLDGVFIKEWECGKDIEDCSVIPVNGRMNVFQNCRGGRNSAYGFIWKYENTLVCQ